MGIFFFIKSPALIEDIYLDEEAESSPEAFVEAMDKSYHQVPNSFIICLQFLVNLPLVNS